MRIRYTLVLLALLPVAQNAAAQSVGQMFGDDLKNAGKDAVAVWGAPFHASSREWALTAAAFGAFGLAMFADQSVSDWAIRNENSTFFRALAPVRRGGKLYSGKYVVPPVAAVYVIGIATGNRDVRDAVTGCMTSWATQSAVRKVVYNLVGRARPDTMPTDPQHWTFAPGGNWQLHSFPAGHAANAFACATFWNKRFHLGVIGPVVYALAGAVGIGRFPDKAHWASDTVLGGILGYAVGKEVARRSLERQRERALSGARLYITPGAPGYDLGIRLSF